MQETVFQAALQAESSKIILATVALSLLAAIPGLIAMVVLIIRSRVKIREQQVTADLDEKRKKTDAELAEEQRREEAALEVQKRNNELFAAMIELLRNSQNATTEQARVNATFQQNYLDLAEVRSQQLDRMRTTLEEQLATDEIQREVVTRTETKLDKHVEASDAAIKTVQEIPTTLQRIEQSVGKLDEQLKDMPKTIQAEINPLKVTVDEIKHQIQELMSEVRRIPDAIVPMPAQSVAVQATILDALPREIVDNARQTPPDGVKVPPFSTPPFATTGDVQEATPK